MLALYSIAFIVNPMMRHETWGWCGMTLRRTSSSSYMCLKGKEVLLMLYYIDKNWHYLIKEYLEQFPKFAFQEVAHPVGQPN